jgi:Domain of unknown function (DUF4328)
MAREDSSFKDSAKLTSWVRYLLYAQVAIAVVSIVSGEMEYRLLTDFQLGRYATEAEAIAAGDASDLRQALLALIDFSIFVVSGVLILMWIYRANYNARQLGANGMTFTPGWSVGWYFVPVATLWKPYQAMKEIWRASHMPADWQNAPISALLSWWWLLWLVGNFLGQAVLRMSLRAKEIDELMTVNRIYLVSDALDIALALVTLALINAIYRAQMAHVRADS